MKVRRDIVSIPKRSAKETWQVVVDLITGSGSVDADSLDAAASVMEALIADEHPGKAPIIVKGVGNRLVIYLAYGENALEADDAVDKLAWNPTAGDWSMTAPADADDVGWMSKTLGQRAPRISVHDVDKPIKDDETDEESSSKELKFDWGALG
jgi:hypothetical protein